MWLGLGFGCPRSDLPAVSKFFQEGLPAVGIGGVELQAERFAQLSEGIPVNLVWIDRKTRQDIQHEEDVAVLTPKQQLKRGAINQECDRKSDRIPLVDGVVEVARDNYGGRSATIRMTGMRHRRVAPIPLSQASIAQQ